MQGYDTGWHTPDENRRQSGAAEQQERLAVKKQRAFLDGMQYRLLPCDSGY